jgi:hypothetical protein
MTNQKKGKKKKKGERRKHKLKKTDRKQKNSMAYLNVKMSIIPLNVSEVNTPIKRTSAKIIKNKPYHMLSIKDAH